MEERAAKAENTLLRLIESIKQEKQDHEEALKEERHKNVEAENKITLLREKMERLVQLTKKQQESDELVLKLANLEKEATNFQTQLSQCKSELEMEKERVSFNSDMRY